MWIVKSKHLKTFIVIISLFILTNCQLKEPKQTHGINFLENREKVLLVSKSNQNDVINLMGKPHTTSINDPNTWIYFQRTLTKGKMHKLGKDVLKNNNVLELKFDKYGVLSSKKLYQKDSMKKVKHSKNETSNEISQQSFVTKFLSSVREKMYGKRKF